MKKKTLLILCFFICNYFIYSQQIEWLKQVNYSYKTSSVYAIETDIYKNVYAAGGYAIPNGMYYQVGCFLEKRDSSGSIIWKDTIASSGGIGKINISRNLGFLYLVGSASKEIKFGNIILNYQYHRGVMAKYDLNNNVIWAIEDTLLAHTRSIYKNNVLYVTGFSSGNGKYYISGYDDNGGQKWIRYYDKEILDFDVLSDSSYVFKIGNGASYDPDSIKKYDSNGNLLWAISVPGYGNSISVDKKGNCYLSGSLVGPINYLAKLATNGQWAWINYNYPNYMRYIAADKELNYFYAGGNDSNNKCWLSIYDTSGNYIRGLKIGDYTIAFGGGKSIIRYGQTFYLGGWDNNIGNNMGFIAKLSDTSFTLNIKGKQIENNLSIYPNPTQGIFQISYSSTEKNKLTLNISNSRGQIMYTETIPKFDGEFKKEIDLSKYAKGIYFIEIIGDRRRSIKRIVVE